MGISKKMNRKLDFESRVHQKINRLLGVIDTFKGSWKVLEQTKSGYLKELRKIATIESTGSSTRIEGATLTDEEVEKLLRSVKINELENSLGNYSRNTIKKDLAYLVNEGILLKTGAGRGVRYHIKK